MTAVRDLVAEAERFGAAFEVLDGRLKIRAAAPLPDDLVNRLRHAKADILAALDSSKQQVENWREVFDQRVAIMTVVGGATEADAQAAAFEQCVAEWLMKNPVSAGAPDRCAQCGLPGSSGGVVVPFGGGQRHAWLHHSCWPEWSAQRRAEAETTIRTALTQSKVTA